MLRSGCKRNGELEASIGKRWEWGAKGWRVSEAKHVLLRGLDSLGPLSPQERHSWPWAQLQADL